jgi:hypothetical protein
MCFHSKGTVSIEKIISPLMDRLYPLSHCFLSFLTELSNHIPIPILIILTNLNKTNHQQLVIGVLFISLLFPYLMLLLIIFGL